MKIAQLVQTQFFFFFIAVHSEVCWEQCWLYSLTAAGRNLGCISLSLKELPSAVTVTCRGRDSCTSSTDSLSIILLSPTTFTRSRGHPRVELAAVLKSISSLFRPAAEMLLLQQTTP